MLAIEAEGLTKDFNGLTAVDHIGLRVEAGCVYGFLGPNGAGKTTTIRMLTTLLKPEEGWARIFAFDIAKEANEVRKVIGLVPQDLTVDDELTGLENIVLQGHLYHIPEAKVRERSKMLLDLLGLSEVSKSLVRTYSGGMRKRLELAVGLLHEPKILFLDEPTLGLDVQTRNAIWEYIFNLNKELGVTIFLTTHYMEEADLLCQRVGIIDRGKIVAEGSPGKLKESLGGDLVELNVRNGGEDISHIIGQISGTRDVSREVGTYRVKVARVEESLPKLFDTLRSHGVEFDLVSFRKPTLDEVYLEHTGRSMRDAESVREDARAWMRRIQLRRGRS